jgi:signal transduction histidine kinase
MKLDEVLTDALSRVLFRNNISIDVGIDEEIPVILADPLQLTQVFMNLARNAAQAMPDGGTLEIKVTTDDSGLLLVDFRDTGIGISDEHIDQIFQPLFTTKAKGIGLGLAISRTFIENHGGTIDVKSKSKEGTTFTVRLPQPSVDGNIMNVGGSIEND